MMLGTGKKIEATAKPGLVPPCEALASAQLDFGMQPVVTQAKVRAEKTEQLRCEKRELWQGPSALAKKSNGWVA